MSKNKVLTGIVLLILGLIGVLSLMTMNIPLPAEQEAILRAQFSAQQIKLLILINPIILLVGAIFIGLALYEKANFKLPIIANLFNGKSDTKKSLGALKYGVYGGLLSGVLLCVVGYSFNPHLPQAFIEFGQQLSPSLWPRFLYGGITEEILMRFGLMTLIVWVASKVVGGFKPAAYWSGILMAAIIFAVSHFPIAFQAVDSPSSVLLTYILLGNSIGGIVFGYLYWKRGLESAMTAHIFTHVVLVVASPVLGI